MIKNYFDKIKEQIDNVYETEKTNMESASDIIVQTYKNDGLVYAFGSGHSSIFATEIFYRPGGLLNIYPIFYEPLMVHKGPMTSSVLERDSKILEEFLPEYDVKPNDCLIIISTSGINPVPIDIAKYFKEKGAKVICITSSNYYQKVSSRHESQKYLKDFSDVSIDNQIVQGDVVLNKNNFNFGSLSTIIGCSIIDAVVAKSTEKIIEDTGSVDIIVSGNVKGGLEHNKKLVEKYSKRIRYLK